MRFSKREFVITAVCFGNIFLSIGLISSSFSAFFPYMALENGLTNTQLTTLSSLRCLATFVTMFFIDRYYHRLDLRRGLLISLIVIAASFLGFGLAKSYALMLISAMLSGVGYGLNGLVPITILVDRNITHSRGTVLGISTAASGVSAIVVPPLISLLVKVIGLQGVFLTICALVLIMAVSMHIVLGIIGKGKGGAKGQRPTIPFAGPILIVPLMVGGVCMVGWANLPMLYTTSGYSEDAAALIFSASGLMLTFGKVIYGRCVDRFGGRKSGLVFCSLLLGSMICCCAIGMRSFAFTALTVVLLGLGMSVASVGFASWTKDWEPEQPAALLKQFQIVYTFGGFLFAPLTGRMADAFGGSYVPSCAMFAVFALVLLLTVARGYRVFPKKR